MPPWYKNFLKILNRLIYSIRALRSHNISTVPNIKGQTSENNKVQKSNLLLLKVAIWNLSDFFSDPHKRKNVLFMYFCTPETTCRSLKTTSDVTSMYYIFFKISCKIFCKNRFNLFIFYKFTKMKIKSFECPKSIRNYDKRYLACQMLGWRVVCTIGSANQRIIL